MAITGFADDEYPYWDQKTGHPTSSHFGNAVQVWAISQDRPVTVGEAVITFNVKPELVRQAIEDHPWMFLSGDTIGHEGE